MIYEATGNELIIKRLGEIEDRKDLEMVWAMINKYNAYALRGFGSLIVRLRRGMYGMELQKSLRRQSNTLKRRMWAMKIRTPPSIRLVDGISLASWGSEGGRIGKKDDMLLNDCYPLGSGAIGKFKLTDYKVEEHGRPPATMYMIIKMARRQSRLFAAMYGGERLGDMLRAIERLSDIHEDCLEFHTEAFIAET